MSTSNHALHPTTFRKFRHIPLAISATCAIVGIAGCSVAGASHSPATTGHRRTAQVPAILASYGSVTGPTLSMSLGEGRQLADEMKHWSLSSLSTPCSDVGGDIASQYGALQATYLPAGARGVYKELTLGYRGMLSAIDECGMAGDAGLKSQLKIARNDLWGGLHYLERAQVLVQTWASAAR